MKYYIVALLIEWIFFIALLVSCNILFGIGVTIFGITGFIYAMRSFKQQDKVVKRK
jgi:hypothetical protein